MRILYIWHAAVEPGFRRLLDTMSKEADVSLTLVTAHRWTESGRDQHWDNHTPSSYPAYGLLVAFRNHIRSFFFVNKFSIMRILLKTKPDIIYIKEEPYSLAAFQWVLFARIFSRKSRILIESDENLVLRQPLPYHWIERFVLHAIDGIACVPTDGIELYKAKGFQKKIYKTSYFVNETLFLPLEKKEASSYFPEVDTSLPAIGYVGRITEEKGIDTLLEAAKSLLSAGYRFHLYLLGSVNLSFQPTLATLLSDPLLENTVHLLKARPMEHLVYFYNLMDAIVLPSKTTSWWKEQFGRVIVESQACGTPVIGSSSGEIPHVVGDPSFVFEENNATALAEIMKKIVSQEISKPQISQKLRTLALSRFSLSSVARQKLAMMKDILTSPPASREKGR
ncbi:glycosyltransferase [Thermospira aquatica]|uniref:Glycosyltransferase n=1 Tax=Thermospira aquatica TaxID=2828656 RepID=A0AAX3BFF1_9SPIR|nr:glycosyltransferase [Thermospira aquatica]URA10868.1 glycosyltransferase [Thermospira aquatica]